MSESEGARASLYEQMSAAVETESYLDPEGHAQICADVPDDERFPFTTPAGSDASMFIQWKGTDVCLDFYCSCGSHGHLDDDFAYFVKCPGCGTIYEMGTQVIARKVIGEPRMEPKVLDTGDTGPYLDEQR